MAPPDVLWPLVSVTGLLAPLCLLAYFCLRIYCLIYTQVEQRYQLGLAWFWIVVELLQYMPTVLLYLNRLFVIRRPRRPQLCLQGDDVPAVSVMITACGEDHDTIPNVVRAAGETDWPNERLSVILCDDGRSKELKEKIGHVRRKYPHAHYTSRPKPEVPDYVCFLRL